MITIKKQKVWLYDNRIIFDVNGKLTPQQFLNAVGRESVYFDFPTIEQAKACTIAARILKEHNKASSGSSLKLKFDSLTSHDLTYVGIIQTARASGLTEFPIPYVLTNCHNSLCAVGGTINRDDHIFGLSSAEKYGGIFVPANQSIIHQYMREMMSGCGRMILGSDSHTRYGALGTMGIGEGGGELVKQLLGGTYDIDFPEVIAVYLEGTPKHGIGPQDVALALIGAVFSSGFVKNKVLEFVGPGIKALSIDFRNGIDVMTTETTCLSSVWCTDEKVRHYYEVHGRPEEYKELKPGKLSCYDGMIHIDLSKIESMIALPFHPSNVYTIKDLNAHPHEILSTVEMKGKKHLENPELKLDLCSKIQNGRIRVDQAEVAGCAGGTFENLVHMSRIINNSSIENKYFGLNIYPASVPVYMELIREGAAKTLLSSGAIIKPAFCGPCFGAGDVPANGALSIRHTTRNFPNREGSKPKEGQLSSVALMDARSIASTSINGGFITPATEIDFDSSEPEYFFDGSTYSKMVYNGYGSPKPEQELQFGPNITDWPPMIELEENILLKISSIIPDPVTTTDELIPSGDAASYRSNPVRMANFTLSRRDPEYAGSAKRFKDLEDERQRFVKEGKIELSKEMRSVVSFVLSRIKECNEYDDIEEFLKNTGFGSAVYAVRPGDGSAREQAASCQRVLGGLANISAEYATKRYRSNLINWGMLPFTASPELIDMIDREDYILIPNIKSSLMQGNFRIQAQLIGKNMTNIIELTLKDLSKEESEVIIAGSLINFYKKKQLYSE